MFQFSFDPRLKAALLRFAKSLVATGITTAVGFVILAVKDPNATATFVADAAASGFVFGVILACEKWLTWFEDPTQPAPDATAPTVTVPTAPTK